MTNITELDVRGLQCPLPLLKLKQLFNRLDSGCQVRVQTTDAGSVRDFRTFAQQAGHSLHACEDVDGVYVFLIEKG